MNSGSASNVHYRLSMKSRLATSKCSRKRHRCSKNEKRSLCVVKKMEELIAQFYSELPELQILAEVASAGKIKKLVVVVKESKQEIRRVFFELQLQISELQLKMQPTTTSEVKEQRKAAIKEDMTTLEATIKDITSCLRKLWKCGPRYRRIHTCRKLKQTSEKNRCSSTRSRQRHKPQHLCKGSPDCKRESSSRPILMR